MENLTMPGCSRTTVQQDLTGEWDIAGCMQCAKPPCVTGCPEEATWQDQSGVTLVDQEKCLGTKCGACVKACQYGARKINPKHGYFAEPLPYEEMARKNKQTHRVRIPGKVDKCDFCLHRLNENKSPMCVEACTTVARIFGDMDDPQSDVSRLLAKGAKPKNAELGTEPKVFYI
jgi:molybdopterin-containing oxidoreductase family iron-sulfur binding subunit